jgi:hypothetical protein
MDLAEAVLARLNEAAAVTAIVGDRITWKTRPQHKELPALVLSQAGRLRDDSLDEDGDILTTSLDADCYALTHREAWALAKAVDEALADEADVDGFLFWNADRQGPIDLGEDAPGGFVHMAKMIIVLRHSADT